MILHTHGINMTRKSVIETKTFTEGDIIYSHNDLSDFIYLMKIVLPHSIEIKTTKCYTNLKINVLFSSIICFQIIIFLSAALNDFST